MPLAVIDTLPILILKLDSAVFIIIGRGMIFKILRKVAKHKLLFIQTGK